MVVDLLRGVPAALPRAARHGALLALVSFASACALDVPEFIERVPDVGDDTSGGLVDTDPAGEDAPERPDGDDPGDPRPGDVGPNDVGPNDVGPRDTGPGDTMLSDTRPVDGGSDGSLSADSTSDGDDATAPDAPTDTVAPDDGGDDGIGPTEDATVDIVEDASSDAEADVDPQPDADPEPDVDDPPPTCDGLFATGLSSETVTVPFGELTEANERCRPETELYGPSCNAAIEATCRRRPCGAAGIGPTEIDESGAVVICLSEGPIEFFEESWGELATRSDGCDGERERFGPSCAAAVHRACIEAGFRAGYGPTRIDERGARFVCLANAEPQVTDYRVLSEMNGRCDARDNRFGLDCTSASFRLCRDRGFTGGYGPVEAGETEAVVICITAAF